MDRERTVGFQVRALSNLFRRCVDSAFEQAPAGVPTGVQSWIIGYLSDHTDSAVYQGELEAAFEVRRSTMTEILNAMEKNGLIIRIRDEHDARKKRLTLTERAKAIHAAAVQRIGNVEQAAVSGISEEELEQFFRISSKLKYNLEEILERKGTEL